MTRKRGKDKRAVPEEILAEGSGPNEVIEADAQALADAASNAVQKRGGRKAKHVVDAWGQPIDEAPAEMAPDDEDASDASAEEAAESTLSEEASVETASPDASDAPQPSTKRGKRAAAKKSKARRGKASAADASAEDQSTDASAEDETAFSNDDEPSDDSSDEPTEAAQSEQALEDAVLRAEAEADLGAASEDGEAPASGEPTDEATMSADAAAGTEGGAAGEGTEAGEGDEAGGAALPTTAATMDAAKLKNLVEALVFAADKPVTLQRLRQLTRVSEVKRLEQALAEIAADYQNRGIALQQVSGGYQFRTNTHYSVWVQQLIAGRPVRLSRAQLETLAIVAYRQPITRPEVDEIRGVDSSATLRLLLDRSLIRVLGKREDVGRPVLYGTTKEFLDFFSLGDLRELPTLREYSELTAESRKVMSDRLGIDADGTAVDEDGNPIDDGTDVLPDAPTDGVEASADPGAEEEAAIEAVSAVTEVIGMEEERIETSTDDAEASAASSDDPTKVSLSVSTDESTLESSDDSSVSNRETSSSDESMTASSDEASSDESSSEESMSASSEESMSASSEESMTAASEESMTASSEESMTASSEESMSASSEESMSASSEESMTEESMTEESMTEESMAASSDESQGEQDLGAPRGSSQEDVLAISQEAAHDVEPDAEGGPDVVGVASEGDSPDDQAPTAEMLDASSSESLDETDKSPAE